jgi:hypothetical protein
MAENTGILPEHSALGGGQGANHDQPQENQDTVKMVMKKFHKYKKYRSRYDMNWLHYYKMWRGDQWDGVRMPKHRRTEVVNMIWTAVQSSLPLQTDVRPKMEFLPEEPTDSAFADVLNKLSDADWQRYNWLTDLTEVVLDGYIYGTGFGCLDYDPDIDYGVGSATFQSEDPFYMYPDPDARNVNCKDSQGFFKVEPVCTDRLKAQFPEFRSLIKADVEDAIQSSKTELSDFKIRTSNSDKEMADITYSDGTTQKQQKTLLFKAYLKPQETEDSEEMSGDGESVTVTRKKYPFGRLLWIANGILLKEEELPFAHGKFPFMRYQNYILPREFYGVSEVEQLQSPQKVFNRLVNSALELLELMGNPVWVTSSDSNVDPYHLINKTGLVIEKSPGSEVQRMQGSDINPTALQMIDRMEQWFNNVAGTQDVTRGQTPGSVTAASAIEQLQEAARTRIRQKQRNLDAFVREMGQQYSAVVLEKYTKPRVFRTTNDEGSTEFFRFSVEPLEGEDGEMKIQAVMQDFIKKGDDETGETIIADPVLRKMIIDSRFDVRVNTGSQLPFVVSDREQKAFNLFDRQIVDAEEVLNILDFPNKEKILERLKQREAAMAEQQQQGGQ